MMDLYQYDGIGQSELIRGGELSPVEAVESAVGRIEALNPELNAVIYKFYDQARKTAAALENKLSASGTDKKSLSPLFGLPFLIKNMTADCKDTQFSDGSAFVEGHISRLDAELIRRYKDGGLIITGRTNSSELGVMPTTESLFYGATLNPWNTGYSPGGSSGGSAAAVASGMVPMAHGNDGGGSLRIPASCCGLFTMKPTRGRNPLGPLFGDFGSGIVCEHALSRSVRDSAALLDISHGPDLGDPYPALPFAGKYLDECRRDPGRLRIGFLTEVPEGWNTVKTLHEDCRKAVVDAAALCESLGHHVDEVSSSELAYPDLPQVFIKIFISFVGHGVNYWERTLGRKVREDQLEPATWDLYQSSLRLSGGEYLASVEYLQLFSRKIACWYEAGGRDLLLSPTMQIPPTKTGAFDSAPNNSRRWIENALSFVAFTRTQNITGQPAISVPLYWNNDGLPVGVQFAAKTGREDLLFRLAGQLEATRPWFNRTPPVFAGKRE